MGSERQGSLWKKGYVRRIRGWFKVICQVYKVYVGFFLGNSPPVIVLDVELPSSAVWCSLPSKTWSGGVEIRLAAKCRALRTK